jgi:hypothetical protein
MDDPYSSGEEDEEDKGTLKNPRDGGTLKDVFKKIQTESENKPDINKQRKEEKDKINRIKIKE